MEHQLNGGEEVIAALFMFGIALLIVIVIAALISYILRSIGLSEMAKRQGHLHWYLTWIPFIGQYYTLGELISPKLGHRGGIKLAVAMGVVFSLSQGFSISEDLVLVGTLFGIGFAIFEAIVRYWLYQKYSKQAGVHMVLATFVPLYFAITVFMFRRNEPRL